MWDGLPQSLELGMEAPAALAHMILPGRLRVPAADARDQNSMPPSPSSQSRLSRRTTRPRRVWALILAGSRPGSHDKHATKMMILAVSSGTVSEAVGDWWGDYSWR